MSADLPAQPSLSPSGRNSMRRSSSIKSDVNARRSSKAGAALGRKRRITPVNPNINMADVTRLTRPEEGERKKLVIPNRSELFHFVCEGDMDDGEKELSDDENARKRHIKWSASFDKPIEELIYPSLQRFNNKKYEERRKIYEKLHGHRLYENMSMAHSTSASASNPTTPPITQTNAPNIKMEMLPEAENIRNEMMFLYTPKWSVEITYPAATDESPDASVAKSPSSDKKSAKSKKTNKFLKFNTNGGVQSGYNKAFRDSNFSVDDSSVSASLAKSEEDEEPNYFTINDFKKHKLRNPLEEIETEGENYLRQQIKTNYEKNLLQDQLDEQIRLKSLNPFNVSIRRGLNASFSNKLPPIGDGGEEVYASLVERHKQIMKSHEDPSFSNMLLQTHADTFQEEGEEDGEEEVQNPEAARAASAAQNTAARIQKLSELTIEEVTYTQQTKYLKRSLNKDNEHLFHGVMFYRFQNQLHNHHIEELKAIEQQKMTVLPKKHVVRSINHFDKRVTQRRMQDSNHAGNNPLKPANEAHVLRNEDPQMVKASDIQALPTLQELHLQRIHRAMNSKATGIDDFMHSKKQNTLKPSSSSKQLDATINAEMSKRRAQDMLLLHQLDAGVLPETFIKAAENPNAVMINLSQYGIGDQRGLCLGKCLYELNHLQSIGLSDNRLTYLSLPTIIQNLCPSSVMNVDLSFNNMHDHGAKAIANHFRNQNQLRYLDLCNCSLKCEDIRIICSNLKVFPNMLEEMHISGNQIAVDGATDLCQYLSSNTCKLQILDLSWNIIGESGAIEFASAMRNNKSLLKLNLSSNGLNDSGGQRFMDSVQYHTCIQEISLAQNSLANKTCFVVTQVLTGHKTMQRLDLSLNPLGEAGARSIFRKILRGLKCFVTMRNCSYQDDLRIYNHTYPTMANPYTLDLQEPYGRAILQELFTQYVENPTNASFEQMSYRENPKAGEMNVQLIVHPVHRTVCSKSSQEPWIIPKTGVVKFQFQMAITIPTMDYRIDDKSFFIMQIIIENGITEQDKKMWLELLSKDTYFTTDQAQAMIDRFKKNRTIGAGGLTVLDVVKSLWKYILDTENMFDFLYRNADSEERRDLVYALTLKRYKFNWANPTSHWTLNLADKEERAVMMQIIAINNLESDYSRNESGRGDTSQYGNWYNFRNGKYTIDRNTQDRIIDKEFITHLPPNGTIDFDYVSTRRPSAEIMSQATSTYAPERPIHSNQARRANLKPKKKDDDGGGGEETGGDVMQHMNDLMDSMQIVPTPTTSKPATPGMNTNTTTTMTLSGKTDHFPLPNGQSGSKPQSRAVTPHGSSHAKDTKLHRRKVTLVTDDEFYVFLEQLGLSNRSKISSNKIIFILMDLQLASTKYYFTVSHVHLILDTFPDDWEIQARVIIIMFSRLKDLHNVDQLLRSIETRAQQDVIYRLGYLNVINPLKIAFDYILSLLYLDNRVLLIMLMELAAVESADQIMEDLHTDLPIATLYGSYTRALNEVRPEVMRFAYGEFGVRTNNVSWSTRKELLKKFLVGTQPMDEECFHTISMFKELESHESLTSGPVDQQYANYLKSLKSNGHRNMKLTKSMVNVMRTVATPGKNKSN